MVVNLDDCRCFVNTNKNAFENNNKAYKTTDIVLIYFM